MTTWGASTNGAWKLGYDFRTVAETDTYIDIELTVSIWTRYSTLDNNNSFSVTGSWSRSGSVSFSTTVNSSWSTSNTVRIWSGVERFTKSENNQTYGFNASLTGVEYPVISYSESVSGAVEVKRKQDPEISAPTDVTALHVTDDEINISWDIGNDVMANPNNKVLVYASESDGPKFLIGTMSPRRAFTWRGGLPDKIYRFYIQNANRDHVSSEASSNVVKTTPSTPIQLAVVSEDPVGDELDREIAVLMTWSLPTGRRNTVDWYEVQWDGHSEMIYGNTIRLVLRPGRNVAVTVYAYNTGDGSRPLKSRHISRLLSIPSPPATSIKNLRYSVTPVSGTIPRVFDVRLTWDYVFPIQWYGVLFNGHFNTVLGHEITLRGIRGTHRVKIFPGNMFGAGTPTEFIIKTPTEPMPPKIVSFYPIPNGLRLAIAPGADGGMPITHHEYRLTNESGGVVRPWTRITSTSLDVTGIAHGVVYKVFVRSVNEAGAGAAAMARSDDSGGRVGVWDGQKIVHRQIRSGGVNAPVRVYNGSEWVLTPN